MFIPLFLVDYVYCQLRFLYTFGQNHSHLSGSPYTFLTFSSTIYIAVVVKLRVERKKNGLENRILLVLNSILADQTPVPGKTISYRARGSGPR